MVQNSNPYKELNFPKEQLEKTITNFCDEKGFQYRRLDESTANKEIYELSKTGLEKARFEIFHLKDGKTTFHPKVGKNHCVGEELANFLLQKVTYNVGHVTSVLIGYCLEDIEPIIELMPEKKHPSGNSFFEIEKSAIQGGVRFVVRNLYYNDKLTITVYNSRRLVIQGLPLSCYDEFLFQMSSLLNATGLANVISKTDGNTVQLVEQQVIESHLKTVFEQTYEIIPPMIRNMLISGGTLRAIKVNMPDYTCFVFPDLRALEGVLKHIFFTKNIDYDPKKGIGELFDNISHHKYELRSDLKSSVDTALATALARAYSFYHKQRHSLFHMDDVVAGSRTITTLESAIGLSDDIHKLIKDIFTVKT